MFDLRMLNKDQPVVLIKGVDDSVIYILPQIQSLMLCREVDGSHRVVEHHQIQVSAFHDLAKGSDEELANLFQPWKG